MSTSSLSRWTFHWLFVVNTSIGAQLVYKWRYFSQQVWWARNTLWKIEIGIVYCSWPSEQAEIAVRWWISIIALFIILIIVPGNNLDTTGTPVTTDKPQTVHRTRFCAELASHFRHSRGTESKLLAKAQNCSKYNKRLQIWTKTEWTKDFKRGEGIAFTNCLQDWEWRFVSGNSVFW
jgi:hypothetical protein